MRRRGIGYVARQPNVDPQGRAGAGEGCLAGGAPRAKKSDDDLDDMDDIEAILKKHGI